MKIAPPPPYGVLKNGTKPLYRDWKTDNEEGWICRG